MSFDRSSTMILQPSCSPKKLTLVPTTGPRSRSTGWERELKPAMKRASTLVGCTGASEAPTSDSACSLRRRENKSESATELGELRPLETPAQIQRSQTRSALVRGRLRLSRSRRHCLSLLLLRLRARGRLLLAGLRTFALHVNAATEVR